MPRGTAFDLEVFKTIAATEIKKVGETATTEVWKPTTGSRFRLCGFSLFTATALTVISLEDETTVFYVAAVEKLTPSLVVNFPMEGYLSVKANNKLKISLTVTGTITATFYGIEEVA
jgi:hypothetical protein